MWELCRYQCWTVPVHLWSDDCISIGVGCELKYVISDIDGEDDEDDDEDEDGEEDDTEVGLSYLQKSGLEVTLLYYNRLIVFNWAALHFIPPPSGRSMMIFWRIKGRISKFFLCCIAWTDSSQKLPVICWVGCLTQLTHSLTIWTNWEVLMLIKIVPDLLHVNLIACNSLWYVT